MNCFFFILFELIRSTIIIRKLQKDDFERGFLRCIEVLTGEDISLISKESFELAFDERENSGITTYVAVDDNIDEIVGTGSLVVEHKFIRNCAYKSYIEDLCVLENRQNMGIGQKLMKYLIDLSKEKKCYKIVLSSREGKESFYEKFGFKAKEMSMCLYITEEKVQN